MRLRVKAIIFTIAVAFGAMGVTPASAQTIAPVGDTSTQAPGYWYYAQTCADPSYAQQCTNLSASIALDGTTLTATVSAQNYAYGTSVWLQINVTDRTTGQLIWRDMVNKTVTGTDYAPSYSVSMSCGGYVLVQAWTWPAGSGVQPHAYIYLPEGTTS